jgi:hypothetical protein
LKNTNFSINDNTVVLLRGGALWPNDLTNNRDSTDNSSSSYTENPEITQLINQASPVVNMTDAKLPYSDFGTYEKKNDHSDTIQ